MSPYRVVESGSSLKRECRPHHLRVGSCAKYCISHIRQPIGRRCIPPRAALDFSSWGQMDPAFFLLAPGEPGASTPEYVTVCAKCSTKVPISRYDKRPHVPSR